MGYYPQFPEVIPHLRVNYPRVTEQYAKELAFLRLAWLKRIPIAATSGRINQSSIRSLHLDLVGFYTELPNVRFKRYQALN